MSADFITDEQIAEIEADSLCGFKTNGRTVLALISRLREAERDAARYRHSFLMPDGGSDGGLHYVISYRYGMTSCKDKETIDEIIDAAMKGEQQ